MRLGITAFLTDRDMAPADLARAVEDRGFDSLYLPEHTHLPVRADTPPALVEGVRLRGLSAESRSVRGPVHGRGGDLSDLVGHRRGPGCPARSHRLGKLLATLDHLSGGRVVFGLGFGWNRAEASDHGVEFSERRAVAREHVLCMQALWSEEQPEFHGTYVDLDPCWSWPKPVQRRGSSPGGRGPYPGVFGAIAEYADGWMPIGGGRFARLSRSSGRLTRPGPGPGGHPGGSVRDGAERSETRSL